MAIHHEVTPVAQEHDHVDLRQKAHRRLKQAQLVKDGEFLVADPPVRGSEFLDFLRFAGETFDDRGSLHVFDQREDHAVDQLAALHVGRLHDSREPGRPPPQEGRSRQARQRERHMHGEHVGHVNGQRQNDRQHLDDHAVHELPHGIHIAGRTVDHRAALTPIEKSKAQPLQFVVNVRTQLDQHGWLSGRDGDRRGIPCGGGQEGRSRESVPRSALIG